MRGAQRTERSVSDLRKIQTPTISKPTTTRFIPYERWRSPVWDEEAIKYLSTNHCLDAFQAKRANIQYDPVERRVVFIKTDLSGEIIGATGRTLIRDLKPKWYRYDKADYPFVCNRLMGEAVLVEDCASAVAVSEVATGIALLGTHLSMSIFNELKNKSEIIVALDPDAHRKGFEIKSKLACMFSNVRCIYIPDDLKYYPTTKIREILEL